LRTGSSVEITRSQAGSWANGRHDIRPVAPVLSRCWTRLRSPCAPLCPRPAEQRKGDKVKTCRRLERREGDTFQPSLAQIVRSCGAADGTIRAAGHRSLRPLALPRGLGLRGYPLHRAGLVGHRSAIAGSLGARWGPALARRGSLPKLKGWASGHAPVPPRHSIPIGQR